jgi:hypothetical protein
VDIARQEAIAVAEVLSRRFLSKSRGRWHISIVAGTNRRADWEAPTLLFHQIGMCSRAWSRKSLPSGLTRGIMLHFHNAMTVQFKAIVR